MTKQTKEISVVKRNGRKELFCANKINSSVERACIGLENVSASEVVLDARITFFDGISSEDIDKSLIAAARAKIYKEPNYTYVAARLLLNCIYKEVFKKVNSEKFTEDYKKLFASNIKKGVSDGVYSEKLLSFDFEKLSKAINIPRDDIFKYHAILNINDRYLMRHNGKVIETPQAYYMRIAMGLCIEEDNPTDRAIELYEVYSQHLASPSTPTLFNSGTKNNQLSSCYLSEIGDSVDQIFDGLRQEALKSKHAGGLGFHVSQIRGVLSKVNGTNGESSGLIPWMKIYNDMLIACNQGGKRNGSGCAYLEPWHIDVEDFIDLRRTTGEERRRTHDLNTALWFNDLLLERVEQAGHWTLFCPSEARDLHEKFGADFKNAYLEYEGKFERGEMKNARRIQAKDLWKKILKSLFETSHPWITFKDTWNARYQDNHIGTLHGSNLCTEIGIFTKATEFSKDTYGEMTKLGRTGVCNLSSLCLHNHIDKNGINYDKLSKTIRQVIRALDNVININFVPTKEAKASTFDTRDIGMGTMGWADVYQRLGIAQDSEQAIELADKLMEFVSYHAILASSELAKERGKYPAYEGSNWSKNILPIDTFFDALGDGEYSEHGFNLIKNRGQLDWEKVRQSIKENGMRNGQVIAIAPNASIAYQMGCEQSIEPNYSNLFSYLNKSGVYWVVNHNFVSDMKKEKIWSAEFAEAFKEVDGDTDRLHIPQKYKDIYRIAFNKNQFKLITANAARQKWACQGISFNLYNSGTSLKFLNDIYFHANKALLKSTYYLRNAPATEVKKMPSEQKPKSAREIVDELKAKDKDSWTQEDYKAWFKANAELSEQGKGCESCEG